MDSAALDMIFNKNKSEEERLSGLECPLDYGND